MITYEFLQQYWWFLISLLGGLLVFLLFVQGGNAQIFSLGKTERERTYIINSTGRKWEFTFTTLVTFGGAFFASFPLFYSTSFGGAYWVWILILFLFVLQAVSYEFQHRIGDGCWRKTFRWFLVLNGYIAPFLIGAAVSTFFTGSDFSVNKGAMGTDICPVISQWGSEWHGLEALCDWRNWIFGIMLMFLSQTLGLLYMINNINDADFSQKLRKRLLPISILFVVFFLATVGFIFLSEGYAVDPEGVVFMEANKYYNNFLQMPVVLIMLLVGVVLVLWGIGSGLFARCDKCFKRSIWPAGIGTVITVVALFISVGFNDTSYYPSYSDLQSSLTISNSCSSLFTLKAMSIVSLIIPLVLAYIVYAWWSIDRRAITKEELEQSDDKY